MSFLIDTDICSAHLRGDASVTGRFLQYTGQLHVSVISIAELSSWVYRKNTPDRFLLGYTTMIAEFHALTIDQEVAGRCGKIAAELSDSGKPIGLPDLLIAATALTFNLTLVTHNARDFGRIPNLRLQDWISS
ncbi:MAG: type II toxin-antitoxin system VapC family toxin [Planctomycetia bacterium]|nr:type II toxin-antitoxin system VapC family toxin [Planctomycetia bacterium]